MPTESPPPSAPAPATARLTVTLRALARQDLLVLAYLIILNLALVPRVGQPGWWSSAHRMGALLLGFSALLLWVRSGRLVDGLFAPFLYRLGLQGSVQLSYFFFGNYLPLVNPATLDLTLYRLDLTLFGFEPALAFNAWVSPFATEWFAFFYFCYFIVLASHTIPILLFTRDRQILGEFALGMLLVFCVGHVGYLLVPGYGPYRALPTEMFVPFPQGFWHDTVMATVASGGAQKDIFPSLHTAAPSFITLFSIRHRRRSPFRFTWLPMAFITVNIIIATMFLRWHWLIDVVAGLLLASLSFFLVNAWVSRELARRDLAHLPPPFLPFAWGKLCQLFPKCTSS